jgi:hypothetical protein
MRQAVSPAFLPAACLSLWATVDNECWRILNQVAEPWDQSRLVITVIKAVLGLTVDQSIRAIYKDAKSASMVMAGSTILKAH